MRLDIMKTPTILLHLLLLLLPIVITFAQSDIDPASYKYHFFCGSSFADIQADTCVGRQWCPSSSDDECLIPGHTCFANSPCDARLIDGVSVPTYSLSLHPEYNDPTDKMFCGVDYGDASSTCAAGGEEGAARHCPDMTCPEPGQVCFIDMPCSYFVMTNPNANPLAGVEDVEVSTAELELPDPGTELSTTFCGATFQQAAADCSIKTWCRNGNSQECPNGMTCYVGVNADNPECEINALTKQEWEESTLATTTGGGGGSNTGGESSSSSSSYEPTPLPPVTLSSTDPRSTPKEKPD